MAEALARSLLPEHSYEVFSAGSSPSTVNPYALRVLSELGIDASSQYSKSVDDIPADRVDIAITLCAEEVCPVFPHPVKKHHWPHPDPAPSKDSPKLTDDEILQAFRDVRDAIRDRLATMFSPDT